MTSINRNWNVLNWNIRGIIDRSKWLALRNKITESNCDVICLQETKRASFDSRYIRNFYPRRINKFEFLPSVGASGGLFIAWNDTIFAGEKVFQNDFSLSIRFISKISGDSWILTNIYGPCQGPKRVFFLDWIKNIQMPDDTKWMLMGDFNYIRYPSNRNGSGGNFSDMLNFNEAINSLALIESPLKGRIFTWSNMQDAPLLEKLAWVFTSEAWTNHYPNTISLPLARLVSNHVPFLIQVGTHIPKATVIRFENFWMEIEDFKDFVKQTGSKKYTSQTVLKDFLQN